MVLGAGQKATDRSIWQPARVLYRFESDLLEWSQATVRPLTSHGEGLQLAIPARLGEE